MAKPGRMRSFKVPKTGERNTPQSNSIHRNMARQSRYFLASRRSAPSPPAHRIQTLYQNLWASYNTQNQMTGTNAPGYALTPPPPLYDAAGDVVNDGQNQYLYDAEGRLCAVGNGYGGTGYLYDAAGNRVAKGYRSSLFRMRASTIRRV
jgi:YD repeat-containing protein